MEISMASKKKSSGSSNLLAPGFRFHPTDEELVRYYLKRKVCGKAFPFDAISDTDVYKSEPWDLPCMSKLKTRDLEWYFFSMLDKKYGNGAKTNRATEKGYWKTTGKDRAVYSRNQVVGMKKTLVYHSGRAPKGQRTNWVMHEYRLADLELERLQKDAFVLCRVFQKSGSGPKNGERYGAPFVEEEWEDDEFESVPKEEAADEIDFVPDAYLDGDDLEQILALDFPSDNFPLPTNFHSADGSCEETAESVNESQNILAPAGKNYCEPEQHLDTNLFDLSVLDDTYIKPLKHEYSGESSNSRNSEDLDFLLDEPFLDAFGDLENGEGGFIGANDPVGNDSSSLDMLEEYLSFFDANDDNSQYFAYDPALTMAVEDAVSDQAFLPQNKLYEGTEQATLPSGQFIDNNNKVAPLSSDKQESTNLFQSDYQLPFIKQASQMLSSIPAPPAFAAEFPSKDAILRLNAVAPSPSTVHVTGGMIQIRNSNAGGNEIDRPHGMRENFNIVLAFGFARDADGSASLESSLRICPGKTISAIFRSGFFFMFLWVLIFSMSSKFGAYICAS